MLRLSTRVWKRLFPRAQSNTNGHTNASSVWRKVRPISIGAN